MWYAAKTQPKREEEAKDYLLANLRQVKEVYIPYVVDSGNSHKGRDAGKVVPAMKGYLFVNVTGNIRRCLKSYGVFYSRKAEAESPVKVYLLRSGKEDEPLDDIIKSSTIPDSAMLSFMNSMEQLASGKGSIRIEQIPFSKLAQAYDTVMVLQGPMKGKEGVVRRVSDEQGRRDRRFYIGLGNSLCISISKIHQNDLAVIHEAAESAKGKAVTLWRNIDAVVGSLQKKGFVDNAPERLRQLIMEYNNEKSLYRTDGTDDKTWAKEVKKDYKEKNGKKTDVLRQVDPQVRMYLKYLCEYFKPKSGTSAGNLGEMIPDITIRPFLTPTSGVDLLEGQNYAVLRHEKFDEYIIRENLSGEFRQGEFEKDKYNPVFDEDYIYYAHVAVFNDEDSRRAIVSWGEFYNQYALLEKTSRESFKEDLNKYRYQKLLHLLSLEGDATEEAPVRMGRVHGIGGFYVDLKEGETELEAARRLVSTVAPAAVEMWQGTRMESWRTLLQHYVLLHKVPVSELPSVIPNNVKVNAIFAAKTPEGTPDIPQMTDQLRALLPDMERDLVSGNPFEAVALFLQVSQAIATHFIDDELWNYLPSDGFSPDTVCTEMLNKLNPDQLSPNVRKYLLHGVAELLITDAWRYFHLPSCLQKLSELKDVSISKARHIK